MPAIASLEHSKFMSENTQDDFETSSPLAAREEARSDETNSLPAHQPETPEEQAPTTEDTLPPEARGEANGGPLGCCLGMIIGLLLGGVLLSLSLTALNYSSATHNYGLAGWLVRILIGILAFVLAVVFARIGWKLGKRFFREYETPVAKERGRRSDRSRMKKVQQKV
jgi:hypothetical protein